MPQTKSYGAIELGPLTGDLINGVLGTELEPGHARLSSLAHRCLAIDHVADYPVCIDEIRATIATPTSIGQAPEHHHNFEMIRRISRPDGKAVKVAVSLESDKRGQYRFRSCYLIDAQKIKERQRKGRLKIVSHK